MRDKIEQEIWFLQQAVLGEHFMLRAERGYERKYIALAMEFSLRDFIETGCLTLNHLAPEFFLNFSTPCISNVNITGTE
jgi:hypothetical protein